MGSHTAIALVEAAIFRWDDFERADGLVQGRHSAIFSFQFELGILARVVLLNSRCEL